MNETLSPEVRAAMSHFGRLGGLKNAATHDMNASAANARAAKAAKWAAGHGCSVCGEYIAIPADLSDTEKARRADALRKRHYVLLGSRSRKR